MEDFNCLDFAERVEKQFREWFVVGRNELRHGAEVVRDDAVAEWILNILRDKSFCQLDGVTLIVIYKTPDHFVLENYLIQPSREQFFRQLQAFS